ncbi:YdbL family protein [Chitinivorax sp. B]|uniref:YdbL family protein n=1 Tax=Chitinivorax sp. B TaxID=2502235 RepID=UPI0010F50BFE|nr:YdbL family protein [Chitinivorax sp. B]
MKPVVGMIAALAIAGSAWAAADLEVNTPAIAQLKGSMQARHGALAPLYASGAVGLTKDGLVALRDANAVPLPQRAQANQLVAEENRDRGQLYKEIARANNHPEWEGEIRSTFAQRWIDKAQGGWFVQKPGGDWVKK